MAFEPRSRTAPNRVNRLAQRGKYDEESVFAAIDRTTVCHATFRLPLDVDAVEQAQEEWPVIIPMIFGRKDQTIYLHGHISSRLLKALSSEGDNGPVKACLAFTNVDGLVVSFSPFHNSNNYESAVVFGHTRLVDDPNEKLDALTRITNHAFRAPDGSEGDRWADSRESTETDIKSTRVIALDIDMASAKVRTGGPNDEKQDIETLPTKYWTGHLVRQDRYVQAVASPYNQAPIPDYIQKMIEKS